MTLGGTSLGVPLPLLKKEEAKLIQSQKLRYKEGKTTEMVAEIWNFVVTIKVALDKDMWTCGVHRFGWLALFYLKRKGHVDLSIYLLAVVIVTFPTVCVLWFHNSQNILPNTNFKLLVIRLPDHHDRHGFS